MAITTSGSLSGSQLQIGIALVLHDRFTNEAREASKELRNLYKEAKNAVIANLQAAESIAGTAFNAFSDLSQGIWNVIQEGNMFIDTMTTVGAITEATNEQLRTLSDTAQTLGMETMFGSVDIASGMKYLAMAGNTAEEINEMIRGAAFVAGATGMDLAGKGGSADLITNIMRMFRIEAAEASTVVGDQLTKATLSANMSMTDLAEAIKYAGADMVTLGQQLPQVAALIGVLGDAGIQGSMAGTAIGNMARYLNKSISDEGFKGFKTLASLGLSREEFLTAKGELQDFASILEKIRNAMVSQGMSPVDMNSTLLSIFGVRGNRAAVALINNLDRYEELKNKIIYESKGYAQSVMETRMASLAGATDALLNSFENLRTTYVQAIEPWLANIFNMVGDFVTSIRGLVATPFGKIASGLFTIGTAVGLLGTAMIKLRAKWLLFKTDSLVNTGNIFTLMRKGWSQSIMGATQYIKILKLAQTQSSMGNMQAIIEHAKMGGKNGGIGGIYWNAGANQWVSKFNNSFVKNKDADHILQRYAQSQRLNRNLMLQTAMSGGYNQSVYRRELLNRFGSASAARSYLNTPWGRISSSLRGIAGPFAGIGALFGGPVGIGITAISLLLPSLISWIQKSKESTDKNTYSVTTLAGQYKTEQERIANRKSLRLTEELVTATNALLAVAQAQAANNNYKVTIEDSNGRLVTTGSLRKDLQEIAKDYDLSRGTF